MLPIQASELLIVEGVESDPTMKARADRLRRGIATPRERVVDDAALSEAIDAHLERNPGRHGMKSDVEPLVIFNRARFDEDEATRSARLERYPALDKANLKYGGYGGLYWRDSGSAAHRERSGLVCQPAWQIHSIQGCHFRCAYCGLAKILSVMMNIEDYIPPLEDLFRRYPAQTLYQYDNNTDTVAFEPEYGGTQVLVDFFARTEDKALLLYVGKSDHVDFMLDYDHRGHTVCCWSLSGRTQSRLFEYRSATMEARIESIRKCEEAGYPVRVRFSPMIPVKNWREETRDMIARLFEACHPDVITMEPIRFFNRQTIEESFDTSLLDPDFLDSLVRPGDTGAKQGCETGFDFRREMYRVVFEEAARLSPETPLAFCREASEMWEQFRPALEPMGQRPERYLCNCAAHCAPATLTA